MRRSSTILAASSLAAALTLTLAGTASAQRFATPPPCSADGRYNTAPCDTMVHRYEVPDQEWSEPPPQLELPASLVRVWVGPSGKIEDEGMTPGLSVALDIGRSYTGARLSAAWLDVGDEKGLSQYTGEIFLDFLPKSRFHPILAAGGGVAVTSSSLRADGSLDRDVASIVGIGTARGSLQFRLPFEEADARVGLDLIGNFPVIRAKEAPELSPWAIASLSVGVGF